MTAASPFAQAYPQLSGLGYSCIPLIGPRAAHSGRGKAPGRFVSGAWQGCPDWQQFRTSPLSGFMLQLALKAPDANVGIVCGTPAGEGPDGMPLYVISVDIDTTCPDAFYDIERAIPPSPMRVKGQKGWKAFYRAPASIRSRGYDDARVPKGSGTPRRLVDVLTGFDTRQAVVAPSHHPDGAIYQWLNGEPVAACDLPIFSEADHERLVETLQLHGYDPEAGRQSRSNRAPHVPSDPDESDPFSIVKAAALANIGAWIHDVPGLYGLRPARGGFECVNTLRDSSSGQPLERRKRNLSLQANGIKDFGTGETWSAIDFVADFCGLSISEALGWLEERLGMGSSDVVIDLGRQAKSETAPAPVGAGTEAAQAVPGEAVATLAEPGIGATHADRPRPNVRSLSLSDWRSSRFVGEPPEIEWLIRDAIPMAIPAMVAAQGDAGKSMALLDLARRVAFNASPLEGPCFGGMVERQGTAVIITAEDDANSIHRRLANLDPKNARYTANGERLIVVPLPDAGGPLPLVREGRKGLEVTDDYRRLADQLQSIDDLAMVVFDPLQAFVHAPINEDPAAGQFACSMMATLAAETQAAVIVAHHTRKPTGDQKKGIKTLQEAREMVRGTTALVDGLRLVYALWAEADGEARKVCERLGVPYEANRVIKGGVVKANGPSRRRISTFVRNENGLLVDQTMLLAEAPSERQELMAALAATVEHAARTGHPFTRMGATGFEANKHRLPPILQSLGRDKLIAVANDALNRGIIVACLAKGSTTAKWLDVPGGPVAEGIAEFALGQTRERAA